TRSESNEPPFRCLALCFLAQLLPVMTPPAPETGRRWRAANSGCLPVSESLTAQTAELASAGPAVWQMHGMDMGTATRLGSFGFFIAMWVVMMAAMMLPGAAPAVLRRARVSGGGGPPPPLFGAPPAAPGPRGRPAC